MRPRALEAGLAAFVVLGAGCPRGGERGPTAPPLAAWQVEVTGGAAVSIDGIALAADGTVAATFGAAGAASLGGVELAGADGGAAAVVIAPGGAVRWARPLPGRAGPIAAAGDHVVVAIAGEGEVTIGGAPVALRGAPGAALVALGAGDGGDRWVRAAGATEWVVVRAVAAAPGGDVAVGGSFAGTLRIGDRVVTSAGGSDGFAARLGPDGEVRWLIRLGGARADAVTAIAAAPDGGIVLGGAFTGDADLRGVALEPVAARSAAPDGFVARLGPGGEVGWARTFGGAAGDAVAGVAVTRRGLVAAAATLRGDAVVDGKAVTARGAGDAAVLTWAPDGARRAVALLGGGDLDTAAALAARGDDLVLAMTYAGRVVVGPGAFEADGGDGALIVVLDASGEALRVHDVAGAGRETIAALAGAPGGWAAAVRHTAGARVAGATLAAPADPYAGAAIVVRPE